MPRFTHFAALDWSGAAGERQRGLALAICEAGDSAPRLVRPGHIWSRPEALHWLAEEMPEGTLAGLDLGMSLPFADCGAFFPGWEESPPDARPLWAMVDRICADDPHLAATSFVDHPQASRYFRRHGGREGDRFALHSIGRRGRFRVTEHAQRETGCNPYSNFNLVGAAQVGKSSLTGMRVLNRLSGRLPIWPVDDLPERGSAVVEIYTSIAAIAAGRRAGQTKIRNVPDLNSALAAFDSKRVPGSGAMDDHQSDALLTAAWLRRAAGLLSHWRPENLTRAVARTEGWTFGAL